MISNRENKVNRKSQKAKQKEIREGVEDYYDKDRDREDAHEFDDPPELYYAMGWEDDVLFDEEIDYGFDGYN